MKVKIGKGYSIKTEIFLSSLFYNKLEIKFTEKNGNVINTSLLPDRVSFKKNEKALMDKISLFSQRLNDSEVLIENKNRKFIFEYPIYFCILLVKLFVVKFFMPNQWVMAYRKIGETKWKFIKYNKNELMADPFIYYKEDKYYVFYEALNYDVNRGYINVGVLDQNNGLLKDIKTIISDDYHFSFPFIFEYEDDLYIVPESSENRTIDLYKCVDFPYGWKKVRTLINKISAVDTILHFENNQCYLFTSEKVDGCTYNDELSIYTSNDLLNDDFLRVEESPVVTDVALARNAGAFIHDKNKYYRVSQDCSRRYGFKVNMMRVNSFNNYKESLEYKLDLPKNAIAMHTYNKVKDIEIVDLKILLLDCKSIYKNALRIIKRLFK
ncbi:hypothetical protein [Photobacterium carnosum]|uniref:glucosamine inositolphosphorylceramide transferase family protein n=1 Tax=Photobacterium carnosum TaxID=2023717 RepID=UPI001E472E5D|nr:hypothetical protein [Photobacterium carnosum]MCD9526044.1 hypothetical protein [Photobacterium carnosum]